MSFKRLWLAEAVHRVTDMRQSALLVVETEGPSGAGGQ